MHRMFWNIRIFCELFARVSKNFSKYFLKILFFYIFSEPIFFLLSKSSISGFSCFKSCISCTDPSCQYHFNFKIIHSRFLVSKTYIYIYTCKNKTCIKSVWLLTGGGVKALADADAKNANVENLTNSTYINYPHNLL